MGIFEFLFGKTEDKVPPSPKSVEDILREVESKKRQEEIEYRNRQEEYRRIEDARKVQEKRAAEAFIVQLERYNSIILAMDSSYTSAEEKARLELEKNSMLSALGNSYFISNPEHLEPYHLDMLVEKLKADFHRMREDQRILVQGRSAIKKEIKEIKKTLVNLERNLGKPSWGVTSVTSESIPGHRDGESRDVDNYGEIPQSDEESNYISKRISQERAKLERYEQLLNRV